MIIPAYPEAYFEPAATYLTLDPVPSYVENVIRPGGCVTEEKKPINGWAALRSRDNIYSFGAITGESKEKMANATGMPMHVIIETENRHKNFMQCPDQTRKGDFYSQLCRT